MESILGVDVRHRLSRLDLTVRLDLGTETLALVGPSAAGKTSTSATAFCGVSSSASTSLCSPVCICSHTCLASTDSTTCAVSPNSRPKSLTDNVNG